MSQPVQNVVSDQSLQMVLLLLSRSHSDLRPTTTTDLLEAFVRLTSAKRKVQREEVRGKVFTVVNAKGGRHLVRARRWPKNPILAWCPPLIPRHITRKAGHLRRHHSGKGDKHELILGGADGKAGSER